MKPREGRRWRLSPDEPFVVFEFVEFGEARELVLGGLGPVRVLLSLDV